MQFLKFSRFGRRLSLLRLSRTGESLRLFSNDSEADASRLNSSPPFNNNTMAGEYLMSTIRELSQRIQSNLLIQQTANEENIDLFEESADSEILSEESLNAVDSAEKEMFLSDIPKGPVAEKDTSTESNTEKDENEHLQSSSTHYQASAAGFSGELARLYERRAHPDRTIRLYRQIIAINEGSTGSTAKVPMTTIIYNYILDAMLRLRQHSESFQLLVEMEQRGCPPDRMTFEVLLHNLKRVRGMGETVEELFALMKYRYGFAPSALAWSSRLHAAIMSGGSEKSGSSARDSWGLAKRVLTEMCNECPTALMHPGVAENILKTAMCKPHWSFLEYFVREHLYLKDEEADASNIFPSATLTAVSSAAQSPPKIRLTTLEYAGILSIPLIYRHSINLPFILHALRQLIQTNSRQSADGTPTVNLAGTARRTEEILTRILYYTSRYPGRADEIKELAYLAFTHLAQLIGPDRMPIPHVEAFLQAVKRPDSFKADGSVQSSPDDELSASLARMFGEDDVVPEKDEKEQESTDKILRLANLLEERLALRASVV